MKLTPEQKAYIKGLDKSKHRKQQKRQFKLQNEFEYNLSKIRNREAIIILTFTPEPKVNWVNECLKTKTNQK